VTFTVVPPPSIASVAPSAAHLGDSVTITGANFLATQGASAVTFNGTPASPATWNDTVIVTPVPATATTGPVVVTVSAQASNAVVFTLIVPGTIAGTITRTSDGTPLSGATVQAVYQGVIKSTATTPAIGTYSIPNLDPGTYDLRVHASGFSSEVRSAVVLSEATATVNIAMSQPGSISGTVTQADGTTPIPGAAVTMFLGGIQKGSTSTSGSGAYSVPGLHTGSYTLQVAYVGYRTKEQGALITENTNTVANVSLSSAPAGPVTYVYDELGRLVSVVDPSGDAATYTYDAVGNILSIGRIASGTVAITEFTPNAGAIGSAVTVYGTGFSATPAQNTLTFNGTAATVTASTTTQITTTVPVGAISGPIAVTTPLGSASSVTPFVVQAVTGAPSISSFSPVIASIGSALTINGANFDAVKANNLVVLHQTMATVTSNTSSVLSTTIALATTSGRVTVSTPTGTAVSVDDLYIPPAGFTPPDVAFTSRVGFGDGASVVASIGTANRIGLLLFDATAGQRISLNLTQSTFSGSLKLFRPGGGSALTTTFTTAGKFIDPVPLAETGTYMVLVDPTGTAIGSLRVTLYDVVDPTTSITPTLAGTALAVSTSTPGQRALATFTAVAGQRVSLKVSAVTIGSGTGCRAAVSILGPGGATVVTNVCVLSAGAFLNVTPALVAGVHTLVVDPAGAFTGGATVTLYDVPADWSESITPGSPGSPVIVSLTGAGQNGILSFTGTNLQRLSLTITDNSTSGGASCTAVTIRKPDGSPEASIACVNTLTAFLDVTPLSATGPYTILVDPAAERTGNITLALHEVADVTGTLTVNAAATPVTLNVPGQNASFTFSGGLNEIVKVRIDPNNLTPTKCVTVKLIRQTGNVELASQFTCGTTFELQRTLPAGDTYFVKLDPSGANTGTLSVRVFNP
jgi:YD repeat-containing protein